MFLKRLGMVALVAVISLVAIVPAVPGRAGVDPRTYTIKITTMDQAADIGLNSLSQHEAHRLTYHVPANSVDVNMVVPKASYQFRVTTCGATYVFTRDRFATGTLLKVRTCTQAPWVGPVE